MKEEWMPFARNFSTVLWKMSDPAQKNLQILNIF